MSEHYQLHSVDAHERTAAASRTTTSADHSASDRATYRSLVVDRVEERGKVVSLEVGPRALELAGRLGESGACARDVAALHLAAVSELTQGASQTRAQSIVTAAHLVLIEVLGHLADRYRDRARRDQRSGLR